MGEDKKTPITINDTEYFVEDLTVEQQAMLNHIKDLERKLNSARFNMDQMTIGRDAFVNMLANSVAEVPEAEVVEEA